MTKLPRFTLYFIVLFSQTGSGKCVGTEGDIGYHTRPTPTTLQGEVKSRDGVWRAMSEKATMFIFMKLGREKSSTHLKHCPRSHCSLSAGTLRTNGKVRIFYQAFNILLLRSRFRSGGLFLKAGNAILQRSVDRMWQKKLTMACSCHILHSLSFDNSLLSLQEDASSHRPLY